MHVCRRWRNLVFGSPRHLNLRICCTTRLPVRDTLDIWPPFPLLIYNGTSTTQDLDNVIAALELRNRVHEISFIAADRSAVEKVLAAMQEPFPELTELLLTSESWLWSSSSVPVVPDSFLGGSAPHLRSLELNGITFPGSPKLLLSATHLVNLRLLNIPHSGYISPDVMVTVLSTLTNLRSLGLGFQSPRSQIDQARRPPPPSTRSVLNALTHFHFNGVYEYLDDLVARIDAPQLINWIITLFNDIVFDAPQLTQFISRTPTLKVVENAHVAFGNGKGIVSSSSQTSYYEVGISCKELDWQVSSLEQICASHLPLLSTLENLYIYDRSILEPDWHNDIENMLWLDLLHRFISVKNLYLCKKFAPRIVAALQELVGDRTTEVLPNLQNIFLEEVEPGGRVQEDIGKFVAVRQLSGHSITVSHWERNPTWEVGYF